MAGLMALVIVATVWPALLRASQQFRLANTSWRGLRFRFVGNLPGAYRATLPLFEPTAIGAGLALWSGGQLSTAAAADVLSGFAALAFVLVLPLFCWQLKKYQHDHLALGQMQSRLRAGAGSFYWLGLTAFGVVFGAAAVAGVLAALLGGGGALALGGPRGGAGAAVAVAMFAAVMVVYISVILLIQPYLTARLQNLVWGQTGSRDLRFKSELGFRPLLWLTLKNWG